jgi:hypothetical protein
LGEAVSVTLGVEMCRGGFNVDITKHLLETCYYINYLKRF